MASIVATGARARVKIDGQLILLCTGVSAGDDIVYDPLLVLDNIEVAEHVPVGYDAAFAAGHVRLIGTSLRSLGLMPKAGSNPADHLRNILLVNDAAVATIEDPYSGTTIATVEGIKVARRGYTIAPRSHVVEDVGFVCKRITDEGD